MTREEAIEVLRKHTPGGADDLIWKAVRVAIAALKEKSRKGLWMEWNYPGDEHIYCSACQERYYLDDLFLGGNSLPNYCPNCGAKMENADAK